MCTQYSVLDSLKRRCFFLCDLQPSFNSSGAQSASWIIHDSHGVCCDHHSAGGASPGTTGTSGKSQVIPAQGEAFGIRILKYENLCPLIIEE